MKIPALLFSLLILSACGGFSVFRVHKESERQIASQSINHLLAEETMSYTADIDEKINSLFSYYLIAQKNLHNFDQSIAESDLQDLYESDPYINLMAIRTQVDEIESELAELIEESRPEHKDKIQILKNKIVSFSEKSELASLSMENLAERLEIKIASNSGIVSRKTIDAAILEAQVSKEFQIYEKNIEHLSHMMEIKIQSQVKKWRPSETEAGNLTGQEFPAKVWSLTFDNGPDHKTTPIVLKNLKSKGLKATFFQLTEKAKSDFETSKFLRDAGMEIGSHSYSHKELTKVGGITLQKEITLATSILEKNLKIDIQFFRLPFGSGVGTPQVRQALARNNLIHVFWNIDTLDWMAQHPDKIVERTKKLMKKSPRDAGVIVFHDIHMRGVTASSEIMDYLKADGRRTCTLGRIVKEMNEDSSSVCSKN